MLVLNLMKRIMPLLLGSIGCFDVFNKAGLPKALVGEGQRSLE